LSAAIRSSKHRRVTVEPQAAAKIAEMLDNPFTNVTFDKPLQNVTRNAAT